MHNLIFKPELFNLPPNCIYLCGHSLGPMPKAAGLAVQQCLTAYSSQAVQAWNSDAWIDLPYTLAAQIAPIIGAHADEVVVSDSTSVNLFKVICSALQINNKRRMVLIEKDNFPADLYIAQGIARFNREIELKYIDLTRLEDYLTEDVAVLVLSHANYQDSSLYDLKTITQLAQQLGILVVADVSHSVGTMALNLTAANVDFAVGCTYKYLNAGPGAPSFCYINRSQQHRAQSPIFGWFGHKQPFAFETEYATANAASSFIAGTPPVLSFKALQGALEIFAGVDLLQLRAANICNTEYLMQQISAGLPELTIISPLDPLSRGGHVAVTHPQAYALVRALIAHGIVCDFRAPNIIRMSAPALYISRSNLGQAIDILRNVIHSKIYLQPQFQVKQKVT